MRWVCSVGLMIVAGLVSAAAAREVSLDHHQLRHHELVHPLVLHPDTAQPHPYKEHHTRVRGSKLHVREARYSLRAFGRDFDLVLDINDDLIGAKFAHVSSSANGGSPKFYEVSHEPSSGQAVLTQRVGGHNVLPADLRGSVW